MIDFNFLDTLESESVIFLCVTFARFSVAIGYDIADDRDPDELTSTRAC